MSQAYERTGACDEGGLSFGISPGPPQIASGSDTCDADRRWNSTPIYSLLIAVPPEHWPS